MVYSVVIHDKHNSDWTDKSYENVFYFDDKDDDNIKNMIYYFENCNIIDYDIFICKNNCIPNNENNYGLYRIDISIIDNQNIVCNKFKKIFNYFIDNNFIINNKNYYCSIQCIGIILKDYLCCIRIIMDKFNNYINDFLVNIGDLNENDKIYSFYIENKNNHKRSERYLYEHYKKQFYNK